MTSIARHDGTQFVVEAYRESVLAKNRTLLQQKVSLLTEQHGQFVCIQPQANDVFDIAISRDPGFLLAEIVRDRFVTHANVIYCERLNMVDEAVLVVIREGQILLDVKVGLDALLAELMPFMIGDIRFDFYLFGQLPFSDHPTKANYLIPDAVNNHVHYLEQSLLLGLVTNRLYQLDTAILVLKEVRFRKPTSYWASLGFVVVFVLVVLIKLFSGGSKTVVPITKPLEVKAIPIQVSVFQMYKNALETPAPAAVLQQTENMIDLLQFVPGWQLTKINYKNGLYTAKYKEDNGAIEDIIAWAKQNHAEYHLASPGVVLTLSKQLPARLEPEKIYKLPDLTARFLDELDIEFSGHEVMLGKVQMHPGNIAQQTVQITIDNLSPAMLEILAGTVETMPLTIDAISLNINDDTVSGTISLSLWGLA